MKVEFVDAGASALPGEVVVAAVFEGASLSGEAARLDSLSGKGLTRAMTATGFTGAKGKVLDVVAPRGLEMARTLLIGVGPKTDFDAAAAESMAAQAYKTLTASNAKTLQILLDDAPIELAAVAALGVLLAAYRFDRYRTRGKREAEQSVEGIQIVASDAAAAKRAGAGQIALANAMSFARDLVSEPANILFPKAFAARVRALEPLGLIVEVLGEKDMAKLGMNALLCVGNGSVRESQLTIIQWQGGAPGAKPMAFVGKGVCFDSGGLSIKAADGMEAMKSDMAGAAAVVGLMQLLAVRKAKVNAVGILGLVENMPDGAAFRPGDIITSMSGQTIEVIDADAEGRMVLADALWYCQNRFEPRLMVDLATLTGAVVTALGHGYAGLFSNDDALAERLLLASNTSGERLWRLPLPECYEKLIDSQAADVKNSAGHAGSAINAALFLQRFVNGLPWAHLDIAPTAWIRSGSPSSAINPECATGFGVRLLNQFVADYCG